MLLSKPIYLPCSQSEGSPGSCPITIHSRDFVSLRFAGPLHSMCCGSLGMGNQTCIKACMRHAHLIRVSVWCQMQTVFLFLTSILYLVGRTNVIWQTSMVIVQSDGVLWEDVSVDMSACTITCIKSIKPNSVEKQHLICCQRENSPSNIHQDKCGQAVNSILWLLS